MLRYHLCCFQAEITERLRQEFLRRNGTNRCMHTHMHEHTDGRTSARTHTRCTRSHVHTTAEASNMVLNVGDAAIDEVQASPPVGNLYVGTA